MSTAIPYLQPENQLLIRCARTSIDVASAAEIAELLKKDLDWDHIQHVAARNGVLSLVSKNLSAFSDLIPESVDHSLKKYFGLNLQRNLYLTSCLVEVVGMLESNDIPVLPFKGPILAARAYGDLSFRTYGDLDVLIHPRDLERAADLLHSMGYAAMSSINWLNRSDWYLSSRKDINFRNPEKEVNLELHWKLSGSHFALPFEMDALWERLETLNIGGTELRSLPFDDLLIYLCLHGSRHSWERFAWICDVNELIRSRDHIDWDVVLNQARALGCEKVLALGLYLTHRFFENTFDFSEWEKITADPVMSDLADLIGSKLFSDNPEPFQIGDRYLYHLKLKENRFDKLKLHFHYAAWYLRIIFTPRQTDKNLFHFPRWLQPLYYVMRPLRLLYTHKVRPRK